MNVRMQGSDEELFDGYCRGDEGCFDLLLDRYRGPLFTVIYKMVGDRALAEDIFQETFLRVIKNRASFQRDTRFSPWVYAIAVNLSRDHLRARKRSLVIMSDTVPELPGHDNPESDTIGREVKQRIDSALAALPEEQREVFLLREHAGLSFKEIAGLTGAGINTVLGRMHLALKKLKTDLQPLVEDQP